MAVAGPTEAAGRTGLRPQRGPVSTCLCGNGLRRKLAGLLGRELGWRPVRSQEAVEGRGPWEAGGR